MAAHMFILLNLLILLQSLIKDFVEFKKSLDSAKKWKFLGQFQIHGFVAPLFSNNNNFTSTLNKQKLN